MLAQLITSMTIGSLFVSNVLAQSASPLPRAHAHNDYLHERPLLDALAHGFCSVEADIFLVNGDLFVAHTSLELPLAKSLRSLYLDPLQKRVSEHKGSVYEDGQVFTLLIDIKTKGNEVYPVLDKMLAEYPEVFAMVKVNDAGKAEQVAGPVVAIVSGDRPVELIEADETRYVGIDGRISDLESDAPAHLMPLISDNWGQHFRWRAKGEISAEELQKLQSMVEQAHAQERRIRFWAIPDNAAAWGLLKTAGVDLINTDKLAELSEFFRR
jgi:hypothetical protein